MKIAILDDYQNSVGKLRCFSLLKDHDVKIFTSSAKGVGQLAIRLAPFDALVLIRERTSFNRALLQKLPNLKVISQTGKVTGHIDKEAAAELGITLLEGVGDPTAPAELTWALIMAATRKIVPYSTILRDGWWQTVSTIPEINTLGTCLKGKTLGIWGLGKIGQMIASYGRAFGMDVLIWGSEASRERAQQLGYRAAVNREAFFSQSDIVSLHLRLSPETRGIVKAHDLACLKPNALLVNTSRAELIEAGALQQAAERGQPIAIDVFEQEPLPANAPILRLPNVLATPHLGYVEEASYELYFESAFSNLLAFIDKTTVKS